MLIVVLCVTIFFLAKALLSKDDHIRSLTYDLVELQKNQNTKLYVTKDEFKQVTERDSAKYKELLDFMKENSLKPKNINEVVKVDKYYQSDTITIIKPVQVIIKDNPADTGKYRFTFNDGCMNYTGQYDCTDQVYTHLSGGFTDETNIIEYWQRKPLWNIKWLKLGKKEVFREIKSKCGEAKTEQIVIGKKPK